MNKNHGGVFPGNFFVHPINGYTHCQLFLTEWGPPGHTGWCRGFFLVHGTTPMYHRGPPILVVFTCLVPHCDLQLLLFLAHRATQFLCCSYHQFISYCVYLAAQYLRCSSLIHSLSRLLRNPISFQHQYTSSNWKGKDENLLNRSLTKTLVADCQYDGACVPRSQYDEAVVRTGCPKGQNGK